ncbi:MAG: cache domain-containing protein, partial [Deltaproteobacteria bacterium]|nr:cache domain-containing protein [Deltaproteobacteria bacterium]
MPKQTGINRLVRLWGIVFLLSVGGGLIFLDLIMSNRDFLSHAAQLRHDYIEHRKATAKQEVDRVVALINYEKASAEAVVRERIKDRTYEAHAVARNLYRQNQDKSEEEIERLMVAALSPVRYAQGQGYYFIARLNGLGILFPGNPEFEGRGLLDLQDAQGRYVIRDMSAIVRQAGEGFYGYHWSRPGEKEQNQKKIAYVKRLEDSDWFVGTGLYVDDVEERIKVDLLNAISRIKFGREGYVFVNRFSGEVLVSEGRCFAGDKKLWQIHGEDPESVKVVFAQELQAAAKPEGDYISYSWGKLTSPGLKAPKVSFICGLPDLQWIVGAGVYLDDVETEIALLHAELGRQNLRKMLFSTLLIIALVFLFILFFSRIGQAIKSEFSFFLKLLHQAVYADEAIACDQLKFIEFDRMAQAINHLLDDKVVARRELQSERVALQRSEAKFRDLLENSPDIRYQADLQGLVVYISPAAQRLSGYAPEEILGKPLTDFYVNPQDRECLLAILRRDGVVNEFVAPLKHRDGSTWWASANVRWRKDRHGKPFGVEGVCRDVSERVQALRCLQEREAKLKSILQASPTGIGVVV